MMVTFHDKNNDFPRQRKAVEDFLEMHRHEIKIERVFCIYLDGKQKIFNIEKVYFEKKSHWYYEYPTDALYDDKKVIQEVYLKLLDY